MRKLILFAQNMKFVYTIAAFASILAGSNSMAQDPLPADSVELLGKLERFEAEELSKVRDTITKKRDEVTKILQTHLQRETQSGNLETAVALKEKIAELSASWGESIASEDETKDDGSTHSSIESTEVDNLIIGPIWEHSGGFPVAYQFSADGTGKKIYQGQPQPFRWTDVENGVEVKIGQLVQRFIIDLRRKEVWITAPNGQKKVEFKPKR